MMQTAKSGIFWTEYLGLGDAASQNLKALLVDCIDITSKSTFRFYFLILKHIVLQPAKTLEIELELLFF